MATEAKEKKYNQYTTVAIITAIIGFFINPFSLVSIAGIVCAKIGYDQGGTDKQVKVAWWMLITNIAWTCWFILQFIGLL